jgi:hypothetical protein
MSKSRPNYEALDSAGKPYTRQAQNIDELPWDHREAALAEATAAIAQALGILPKRPITFGHPVHTSFGMMRPAAKKHPQRKLLLTRGHELSLDLCPTYN